MKIKIGNPEAVLMKSIEDACALTAYAKTLEKDKIGTVDYQKNFTTYYRVRRDGAWLARFYAYLDEKKDCKTLSFREVLETLSSWEHAVKKSEKCPNGIASTIEVSFSSKLLATVNPRYPIWDSQVVRALGIVVEEGENKIDSYVRAYAELTEEIARFIASDAGKKAIALFDRQFPNYTWVSDYKKIDFYLWNIGK